MATTEAPHEGDLVRHLPLVKSIASKHRNRGVPFDDLVQEGYLGLRIAADRFEPARGTTFSTYATYWIRNRIGLALSQTPEIIRRPEYIVRLDRKIARIEAEDPGVTDAAIIAEALTTEDRLSEVRLSRRSQVHPDADGTPLDELAVAPEPSGSEEDAVWIHAAIGTLSPVERWVIGSRYGLKLPGLTDGSKPRTLSYVAKSLRRSPKTVRDIETRAIQKLREALA